MSCASGNIAFHCTVCFRLISHFVVSVTVSHHLLRLTTHAELFLTPTNKWDVFVYGTNIKTAPGVKRVVESSSCGLSSSFTLRHVNAGWETVYRFIGSETRIWSHDNWAPLRRCVPSAKIVNCTSISVSATEAHLACGAARKRRWTLLSQPAVYESIVLTAEAIVLPSVSCFCTITGHMLMICLRARIKKYRRPREWARMGIDTVDAVDLQRLEDFLQGWRL